MTGRPCGFREPGLVGHRRVAARNSRGWLPEEIHAQTGEMRGNLSRTCSMAVLIDSAMRLSVGREEGLCRGSW